MPTSRYFYFRLVLDDVSVEDIENEGFYCDHPYTKEHIAYGGGMKIHFAKYIHEIYGKGESIKGYNPWLFAYDFERVVPGKEDKAP